MSTRIRIGTPADAAAVKRIYDPMVIETAISFEEKPPRLETIAERMREIQAVYPWLVCERHDEVIGYAYAGRYAARAAYRWSVEASIYIDTQARRLGIGRALYTALFDVLRLQGYYRCFAGVTLPNAASVGLHESLGFTPVGVYHASGHKLGQWHDVGWWELGLHPTEGSPASPVDFPSLVRDRPKDVAAAFAKGEAQLREG